MRKLLVLAAFLGCFTTALQAEKAIKMGVVSISGCIEDSQKGIKGRQVLESLNQQMTESLQDTDKKINEINDKLADQNFKDSLSTEALSQLHDQLDALAQERDLKRAQFVQQLSQVQMMIYQQLYNDIKAASKKVSTDQGLDVVINDDAVAYYNSKHDVTKLVVKELNNMKDTSEDTSKK